MKQETYVHSLTGRTESKPETNALTTKLHGRGGYCCPHFCSASSRMNLVPHFSLMAGLKECFVLKT